MYVQFVSAMAQMVEIYFGYGHRKGKSYNAAVNKVNRISGECHFPMGPLTELAPKKFRCDMAYYEFYNSDNRPREFVKKINKITGLCAKIVVFDGDLN